VPKLLSVAGGAQLCSHQHGAAVCNRSCLVGSAHTDRLVQAVGDICFVTCDSDADCSSVLFLVLPSMQRAKNSLQRPAIKSADQLLCC
jgi:hypothetical protein